MKAGIFLAFLLLFLSLEFLTTRNAVPPVGLPSTHRESAVFSSDGKIQSFPGPLRLSLSQPSRHSFPRMTADCEKWAIASTDRRATALSAELVRKLNDMASWCFVLVGYESDSDGLLTNYQRVTFLSGKKQAEIAHPFVQRVLSSYRQGKIQLSPKNIAYLFAIRHGAKVIYETSIAEGSISDLDHLSSFFEKTRSRILVRYFESTGLPLSRLLFDPLPHLWPTSERNDTAPMNFGSIDHSSLGILATLSLDSDIERTNTRGARLLPAVQSYAIPAGNSFAFTHAALWGLFLPATVHEDFRFYFAQKFLHELNLSVVFESSQMKGNSSAARERIIRSSFADDVVTFLASKEAIHYPKDELNTNLPCRIEMLMVDLFEHGHLGVDDVYAMQEWLLALIDVGYLFPSLTSEFLPHTGTGICRSHCFSSLEVVQEPLLEGQPYLASPAFNVDKKNRRYEDFIAESGNPEGSRALFAEWNSGLKSIEHNKENQTVFKIVAMSMNEWPLIKDWVTYHGQIIGFENLYIIDGSTDVNSINFLVHARNRLGVSVIFSDKGLNSLEMMLSELAKEISKASHFIAKLDTDEFLVGKKADSVCHHSFNPDHGHSSSDCTLSPYVVQSTLEGLRMITSGERLRFGYVMRSESSATVCKNDKSKSDIGSFPLLGPSYAGGFKTISDSRTLAGIDLGGHNNMFVPPFGLAFGNATDLGIIHFHTRCFDDEVANCRKALISHKFLDENDTDEVATDKLLKLQAEWGNPLEKEGFCDVMALVGVSSHKILFYLKYLLGCISEEKFYPSSEGAKTNPEFVHFLNDVRLRYSFFA